MAVSTGRGELPCSLVSQKDIAAAGRTSPLTPPASGPRSVPAFTFEIKVMGSFSCQELENGNKETKLNYYGSSKWVSGFSFSQGKLVGEENAQMLHLPVQRNPVSHVVAKEQHSSPPKAFNQLYTQWQNLWKLPCFAAAPVKCYIHYCLLRLSAFQGRSLLPQHAALPPWGRLSCSPAGPTRMRVSLLHQVKKGQCSPAATHQRCFAVLCPCPASA